MIAHGQLSPGGVVVATALHLLYVAVDYRALRRTRLVGLHEIGDALGETTFLVTGWAGLLAGSAFLANVLPLGTFNTLSSGTVPALNAAIGVEVACAVAVLLSRFLDQALRIEPARDGGESSGPPQGA